MQYLIAVEQDGAAITLKSHLMATLEEAQAIDLNNPPPLTQCVDFMLKTAEVWIATQKMTKAQAHAYVNSITHLPTAITH